MKKEETPERRSHCIICGLRLSTKTSTDNIKWQPSQVDDYGLYCDDCFKVHGKNKSRK